MSTETSSLDVAREVLRIESEAVAALADRLDESFDRAVDLLVDCRGRILVSGMGKSGLICQKIAATLTSVSRPSSFIHPAEAMHGDLGLIVAGDVLIAMSNSGETAEIVRLVELVRRLDARVIGISGSPTSTLARFADVHLDAGVDQEACSWDLIPTASTTACLALGDALAVATYRRRGFSPQDFARNHPGGRLARKLLQVHMLMHTGDEMPVVSTDVTMRRAVEEINEKRLGMTNVVDADGRLVGVLTDGDLRRRLLGRTDLFEQPIERSMTADPVTIAADSLASEALKLMEERKITSVPVVDEERVLLGVIQIHDLWRTELF